MPINILMPALSPTMEKGNLAKWLKKEGDTIKSGDIIVEIETDKATMEVEAVDEGTLAKILVPEGTQDVPVNQPIAVLAADGEDVKAAGAGASSGKGAAPSFETQPSAAPQDEAGKTQPPKSNPRPEEAASSAAVSKDVAKTSQPATDAAPASHDANRTFASPLARRIAKESGIDVSQVKGSGPHGRVVKADIEAAKAGGGAKAAPAATIAADPALAPGMNDAQVLKLFEPGSFEIVPHDNIRKIIAKRLVEAKQTIPHFYLTIDTEIDALLALRTALNDAAPKDKDGKPAWKVSVNDMVIKALALALQRVPDANVTWTEGGMLRHKRSDVGVAVSIPGGLITPVVRKAEEKRISQIAIEMKDYAARARARKLAPHEYQGGTSAVSNLGMFGIKDFAAVINPPHATILAVGAGIETPVVRDGKVEIRTIMTCTLSTDHRAVDGALGAQFINAFKELIEKPAAMLA